MVFRGKIKNIIHVNESISQVVVQTKRDDVFFPICFTCFLEIKILINQIKLEKGDHVKIDYYIKSNKHENKYYTSAIIEKIKILAKKAPQYTIDMETGELY